MTKHVRTFELPLDADHEMVVMKEIVELLQTLDHPEARFRVIDYARSRTSAWAKGEGWTKESKR